MVIRVDNSEIISKVFELRDKIINSEVYRELKEKEDEMMRDEGCFKLLSKYQEVQSKYNDAKRFEKYGSDIGGVSKELSDIKASVEKNELVKSYNESYKKMKKELKRIESILFEGIVKEKKEIDIE